MKKFILWTFVILCAISLIANLLIVIFAPEDVNIAINIAAFFTCLFGFISCRWALKYTGDNNGVD